MGIVINSSTGEIDVASSTPGTYRITYTTNGDCPNSSTQDITINALPTISISASSTSICAGDSVTLTASGAGAGGSYSWNDGQTTAAITVTPGATVTYYVTGTDANGCFNSANQQITVTAVDSATVTYSAASYCQMPTGALAVDGYYPLYANQADANAASSDGSSHSHSLTGGTYYMPNAGVVIYHGTYSLTTPAPTITGQSGTFSESTGNLSIDSSTGVITLNSSTVGSYTVVYTTNGSCPNTVNNTITVNALDGATFAYSSNSLPQTGTASLTTTPTTSGGVYSAYPSGLSINSSTGEIDLAASTIQSYKIFYETSGAGCPNSSTFDLAVTAAGIANNYSMSFDGVNDYIDLNSLDQSILNSSFTVSFWLNKTAKGGGLDNDRMIDLTVSSSTSLQIITDAATNKFGVNFIQSGSSYIYRKVFNNWNTVTGSWHHIALTWDGSSYEYYFDGSSVATTGTSSIGIGGTGFYLGKRADGVASTEFKGGLDEVAIWNTALTSTQIQSIYNATSNNLTKDLSTIEPSNLKYWNRMGD
jgi:hypothetical protein